MGGATLGENGLRRLLAGRRGTNLPNRRWRNRRNHQREPSWLGYHFYPSQALARFSWHTGIQKFVGALHGQRAKKGVFITTSSDTADATDDATRMDTKVVLIDGNQLAGLMMDFDVGVSVSATYIVKRVDADYFEGNQDWRCRTAPVAVEGRSSTPMSPLFLSH